MEKNKKRQCLDDAKVLHPITMSLTAYRPLAICGNIEVSCLAQRHDGQVIEPLT